jgi:quercetin dioxygenase-like cupin family protein
MRLELWLAAAAKAEVVTLDCGFSPCCSGDPSQPGLYVDRIKFLPGMKVMPHWHPDTVRTVLVMSGTFYFAVGEQWDESKLKPYPAGTLYSEPAKTPHYAWAKDGEVILQVTAIGPTGNTPIPQKQ